jgi:hypothetical protein
MGSSGMKKKGRKHQPKVGTPKEQQYALHKEQQAVVGNFGVRNRGWMFWTALVVIVAIVAFSLLSWVLWF